MDISELKQGQKIKIDYEDEIFVAKVKKLTPKFVIIKYDVDGSTEKINLNSFRKRITKIFKSTVRRIVQKNKNGSSQSSSSSSPKTTTTTTIITTTTTTRTPRRTRRKPRKNYKEQSGSEWEMGDSSESSEDDSEYSMYDDHDANDNNNNDESDYELDSSSIKKFKRRRKKKKPGDDLRCNECKNSEHKYNPEEGNKDVITMENLDPKHIEWISPDGKMKQCYNIQTLLKIACKDGKNILLQPPHFRAPMDRTLKDQIENKFPGVISKLENTNKKVSDLSEYDGILYDGSDLDDEMLENYFQRYGDAESVKYNWMSDIGDMYVCPLCFSYLSDLLDIENETSDNEEEIEDPLEILTHQGIELGAVALTLKQAEMKVHLSTVHKIPKKYLTKKAGCTDVLKRYTLRDSDGLIQQYCHSMDNQHHKTYYSRDSWLNRGNYNALYYTILLKAENQFPELFSKTPIWTILEKGNTKEAEEYCGKRGIRYFLSLISQWSNEESALDSNFIANEDSFDEESSSSSSSSSSSNSSSSEEDDYFGSSSSSGKKAAISSSRKKSSSSSRKKRNSSSKKSSTTPHLYFTQRMEQQEQDLDDLAWETRRYEDIAKRRGLPVYEESENEGFVTDDDEDSDSNNNNNGVTSSVKKRRRITALISKYRIGQEILVMYRSRKGREKWYDAKVSVTGQRSIKVLYEVDQSTEWISVNDFSNRIKLKPLIKNPTKKRPAPALKKVVEEDDDEDSDDDDDDVIEVVYNDEEEIVSVNNKKATTSTTSTSKRKRRRLKRAEISSSSSDDEAPLVNRTILFNDNDTAKNMSTPSSVSASGRKKKQKTPLLPIHDSDDDDDDDDRVTLFEEEEDDGDNSSSSDDCL